MLVLLGACETTTPDEPVAALRSRIDASASVVISQVYGGGGNNLGVFKNDFIELFNRSPSVVSLDGLSVQYASSTGSFTQLTLLAGSLGPGQHYLVQEAAGTDVTQPALPAPDKSGTLAMSGTTGKVALVRSTTALGCGACTGADLDKIIDVVGYGAVNLQEGAAAAPALTNSTAALRATGGCTDTNQNGSDFAAGVPNPRNTASAVSPCSTGNVPPQVTSTSPTNGAANIALDSNIGIVFSENVVASGSWYALSCTASGNVSAALSGGPQTYVLNPNVDLQPAETCTVTLTAASIVDADGAPMASNYVFNFTTSAPTSSISIHTIQGASHISPLNHSAVTTRGIVTAVDANGYYLQEPTPDADPATSEGIFAFTSSAPTVHVGDDVQLSGTVNEFRSGCSACAPSSSAYANLTTTEIGSITAQAVLTSGHALPAAVVIGVGGRVPPTSVIEDDATGDVELVANTFDPGSDGLDFYESLESMRVQVNNAVAVGPTATFSGGSLELPVLADNGSGAVVRTTRGGIVVSASDFNPERITLANDLLAGLPSANVGDTFPGSIVGVLGYTFANFKLEYTQVLPALVPSGVAPEVTTLGARHPLELDVAAFNVENLDPLDPASKFSQLAGILVNGLESPDIVSLEEIQDNDGPTDSGVVDATTTLNQLVAAVSSAGGPTYQYRVINPVNDQDGGEPGGNIRVAFLFRTDRGLSFVDRPGAGSLTPNTVVNGGSGAELQFSPGRIDPMNAAFSSSRKPLAGQFSFGGQTFFVIANHFNSKGGDDPLFGRFQPPTLSSETQRTNQANIVKGFVSQILALSPAAQIVVLGDLNDFEFSAPVTTLKSAGLSDLIERLPQSERYTYVYQGNSQALDHILVSSAMTQHVVAYDVVHVNSEFAVQASDHDPGIARVSFDRLAPVITVPGVNPVVNATGANGATVTYSVTATDDQDGSLAVSCVPASGSLFPVGVTTVNCSATDAGGNLAQKSFTVTVKALSSAVPAPATPIWWVLAFGSLLFVLGQRRLRAA